MLIELATRIEKIKLKSNSIDVDIFSQLLNCLGLST